MLTLNQATDLLADAYEVPRSRLQGMRKRMTGAGMLPLAKGRDIPHANPTRTALLLMGLGISDLDRLNELADARVFQNLPGDDPSRHTLLETLSFTMLGLMNNPGDCVDGTLCLTNIGSPVAFIQMNGTIAMQFSAGEIGKGFINGTVHIALQPLTEFCIAAHATQPPFKAVG